ncbi:MAG: hypothetical protein IT450_21455 [Phycisphaerales bacterium]|nr:hypothetical protein [Phycisphaerales bacterium]
MSRAGSADRFLLLNPNTGRPDRTIDAEKYAAVKRAILKAVPRGPKKSIAFGDLAAAAKKHLPDGRIPGGGALAWYVTSVKLDLEARGLLVCDRKRSPQTLWRA